MKLRKSQNSWENVALSVAFRQYRQKADDIQATSPTKIKKDAAIKFVKEKGEPRLFDRLMGPREFKDGQVLPYDLEIPDNNPALKKLDQPKIKYQTP